MIQICKPSWQNVSRNDWTVWTVFMGYTNLFAMYCLVVSVATSGEGATANPDPLRGQDELAHRKPARRITSSCFSAITSTRSCSSCCCRRIAE